MLQLVNLSNDISDVQMIKNDARVLEALFQSHGLDGLELMLCQPWNPELHRREWIHGVHLRFWPSWLDFWRERREELLQQFNDDAAIAAFYGGLTPASWLTVCRSNIRAAAAAGAKYAVLHVSHSRMSEAYSRKFSATHKEVITATIELVNELVKDIPDDMELLFENLWWPGLTLREPELVALLLEEVRHSRVGLMLDTGHLMNTNTDLRNEEEAIAYVIAVIKGLGSYRQAVRGIHLHQSLSGDYVKKCRTAVANGRDLADAMSHILRVDEHRPFTSPEVRRIIDYVEPAYLVHEFIQYSWDDWMYKLDCQQAALQCRNRAYA
ncbi:MAG TPA: TIM barrel protein [Patescibacteria group bacterium]|nr:TIM barrel protein [Patescibacteria group bacterium]